MKFLKRLFTSVLSLSMLLSFAAAADIPAEEIFDENQEAALDSESMIETASSDVSFDFSSSDSIDQYDTYEKKEFKDGTFCVPVIKMNNNNPTSPGPASYRYGAYLRHADEEQPYYVINAPYTSKLYDNTLTIYADPGVKFEMTDYYGAFVLNEQTYNSSKVLYYRKSTDNGHNVYYIELKQATRQDAEQKIVFTTESTTSQPHYSFWFGQPLLVHKKTNAGTFYVSVSSPYTESVGFSIKSPYSIPEKSWVTMVNVKRRSSSGANYIRSADLRLSFPNSYSGQYSAKLDELHFDGGADSGTAVPAKGVYQFSLRNVSWNPLTSSRTFSYEGQVEIEYACAFGAS